MNQTSQEPTTSTTDEIDALADELELTDFDIPGDHDEELAGIQSSSLDHPTSSKASPNSSFPQRQIRRAQQDESAGVSFRRTSTSKKYTGMQGILHQVRRQSGLAASSESDDDLSIDTEDNRKFPVISQNRRPAPAPSSSGEAPVLSTEDIEICQRLDDEYERALEEREIGYNARYASVRQSAFLSVFFMFTYLLLGTIFFMRQAAWSIPKSLLFSIYTITTVGYGNMSGGEPTTPGFQAYTIFYILIGIATLTIMVAQVYQCIALEASRAQHSRDKSEMAQRGLGTLNSTSGVDNRGQRNGHGNADEIISYHNGNLPKIIDQAFRYFDRAKHFFRESEIGRGISVIFPFAGLILIGAVVIGPIEGWTALESIYFSVVSLTTVGFGDYVPTELASIWFCIFWLPFSVGFMSMYLGNVAAFYIRLSDRNIRRIEKQMRRRMQHAKDRAEVERAEVLKRAYRGQELEIEAVAASATEDALEVTQTASSNGNIPKNHAKSLARKMNARGFDALPTSDGLESEMDEVNQLFGSSASESGVLRRQRIIENSNVASERSKRPNGRTMQSMKDVVNAVRQNLEDNQKDSDVAVMKSGPAVQFMSIRSTQTVVSNSLLRRVQTRKPSFALRVLVQERFAEIIATDIAGFQSSIEIKETTLSVRIDSLKDTADKWSVPRRARKAFRAVAFEVLYFVGEHGLITRGADALYDLSPFEFHGLFSPLLAAMGDADTMEGWLASTDVLAEVDLKRDGSRPSLDDSSGKIQHQIQEQIGQSSSGSESQEKEIT